MHVFMHVFLSHQTMSSVMIYNRPSDQRYNLYTFHRWFFLSSSETNTSREQGGAQHATQRQAAPTACEKSISILNHCIELYVQFETLNRAVSFLDLYILFF
jgi:hypothetical protein